MKKTTCAPVFITILQSLGQNQLLQPKSYFCVTNWWFVRVTLVVAFGFCPKILGGGGDLQNVILLEKECIFSSADNVRWWGH